MILVAKGDGLWVFGDRDVLLKRGFLFLRFATAFFESHSNLIVVAFLPAIIPDQACYHYLFVVAIQLTETELYRLPREAHG